MKRTLRTGEFHGRRRETCRHAGLTLADAEYRPGHHLPTHAHANPFFSLLVRGHFRETLDRGTRECHPASLVFYPEHEPHGERFGPAGGRSFNVELGPVWMNRLRAEGSGYPAGSRESLNGRVNVLTARLHAAFLESAPVIGYDEIVIEMLAQVGWAGTRGRERTPPPWLTLMIEQIHERCTERLTVAELADEAGVHPVYAARAFRAHRHCSIGQFVLELRIERARMKLGDPTRSLSAIALDTGFADQAHFSRQFKKTVGIPPGAYRRSILEN